ncbi:MAG: aminotransferase class V-fold PLP-dependent enzyme [Pseudomonadota bacterium]
MTREKFHLNGAHYLLSHSIGAQPKAYDAHMRETFAGPWRENGPAAWDAWLATLEDFKTGLAPLIGAAAGDVCPQTNISSALTKILFSLPERPGRKKIVLSEDDFPTCGFVMKQAERLGYELVFLSGGEALADADHWTRAIGDDVQLVLVTHVFSNSSIRAPVEEIAAHARKKGAYTIVDIAQSAGAVPIRLDDWAADFAVGTCLKYLCGGPGAAYLWARADTAQDCAPFDVGWFSHKRPFAFDIHDFEYGDGATRFMGGTPSIAPFAGARPAFDILREAGVDKVFAHNQALLSRLTAALPPSAFLSTTKEGARGSAALIKPRDLDGALGALKERGVVHDQRLGAVRISIHLYNDETDIDAVVEAVTPFL